jgi:hypothetical protein
LDDHVLVVNRFRDWGEQTQSDLESVLVLLRTQRGYVDGAIGRNLDEPDLWLLWTRWEGPGAYRRALSTYDVKTEAWPVLSQALDEPSAYEIVQPGARPNRAVPRGSDSDGPLG